MNGEGLTNDFCANRNDDQSHPGPKMSSNEKPKRKRRGKPGNKTLPGTPGNDRHREAMAVLGALGKEKLINKALSCKIILKGAREAFTEDLKRSLMGLMPGETLLIRTKFEIVSEDKRHVRKPSLNKRQTTPEYDTWRKAVFARDGWACTDCGAKDDIQAHHKKPFADFPELRHDVDNGQTLCRNCHAAKHPHLSFIKR